MLSGRKKGRLTQNTRNPSPAYGSNEEKRGKKLQRGERENSALSSVPRAARTEGGKV